MEEPHIGQAVNLPFRSLVLTRTSPAKDYLAIHANQHMRTHTHIHTHTHTHTHIYTYTYTNTVLAF